MITRKASPDILRKGKSPKRGSKWFRILTEFIDSPEVVIELVPAPGEYANMKSLQGCACGAISRYGFLIHTTLIDDRVYLIKVLGGGALNV